jgi:hypothetical protein
MKISKTTTVAIIMAVIGGLHLAFPTIFTVEVTGAIETLLGAAGLKVAQDQKKDAPAN